MFVRGVQSSISCEVRHRTDDQRLYTRYLAWEVIYSLSIRQRLTTIRLACTVQLSWD